MTQEQLEKGKFLMERYYSLNDKVGFVIHALNQNRPLYINTGEEKSIIIPDKLKNRSLKHITSLYLCDFATKK